LHLARNLAVFFFHCLGQILIRHWVTPQVASSRSGCRPPVQACGLPGIQAPCFQPQAPRAGMADAGRWTPDVGRWTNTSHHIR
jgi:hypothetical protein